MCVRSWTVAWALLLAPLSPAAGSEPAAERAAAAYAAGREAFLARDFEAARAHFERAYLLDPSPVLLFNLARASEELGDARRAIRTFELYLDRAPDASDRADVERRVRVMRAILDRSEASERSDGSLRLLGWTAFGLAAVSAGAALWFGLEARSAEQAHQRAATGRAKLATADEARTQATRSNIALLAAGALAAAGVTLWVVDARPGAPTLAVDADGPSVVWRGRFE